jgi:hypothetical protein
LHPCYRPKACDPQKNAGLKKFDREFGKSGGSSSGVSEEYREEMDAAGDLAGFAAPCLKVKMRNDKRIGVGKMLRQSPLQIGQLSLAD